MEDTFKHDELYAYPGRLTWLSMEAFGKFVSTLMHQLVLHNEQLLEQTANIEHTLNIVSPAIANNPIANKLHAFLHIIFVHFQRRENHGFFNWLMVKILEKYVRTVIQNTEEQNQSNPLQDTCEYLQRELRSVPSIMLHELTIRILRHVELTYLTLLKTCSINSGYQEISTEIMKAILYPSITKVEFSKCGEYESHIDELNLFKMKSRSLFDTAQPKLNMLKALDIQVGLIGFFHHNMKIQSKAYKKLRRIEELTCNRLAWNKLHFLIHHCTNLKIFNLDGTLKPYDVPFILKISKLEELKFHTRCNDRATELLIGLSQTKRPDGSYISQNMKKLGKFWPSANDIYLISKSFTDLTSLSLVCCNCNLSPLKTLKNLKDLSIQTTAFEFLKDLLTAAGKQLDCLELTNVYSLDLNHIVENCVSLRCFHLLYRTPLSTMFCNKNKQTDNKHKIEIPEFPSVKYLQLKFPSDSSLSEHIFMKFPNVSKLDLIYFQRSAISQDLIHVKLKPMKKLQVAYIRCLEDDSMFLVQFFEEHVVITNTEQSKLSFRSIPI